MLTVNANAKINWSLSVTGVRENGYHELDMLMQSISLHDTLTFAPSDAPAFTIDGTDAAWDHENLICRAADLMRRKYRAAGYARIGLIKRIPERAGLGGGSADAAAVLLSLNRLWRLNLSDRELCSLGLSLGADVPFCLKGGLARVTGVGETVSQIEDAPEYRLVLIMPDEGLSTADVFCQYNRSLEHTDADCAAAAAALIRGDLRTLKSTAFNDLTDAAVSLSKTVYDALSDLKKAGARFCSMSGSGSCCFGVFDDAQAASAALGQKYRRVFCVTTRRQGIEIESSAPEF